MPEQAPAAQPAAESGGAEGVQGFDAGQGGQEANGETGLYDLSAAPEELRPHIEAELKKIEGNVTRRFQEFAELRKAVQPFVDAGIANIPTEELPQVVGLYQTLSDPEQFEDFWYRAGERLGLFEDDQGPVDLDMDNLGQSGPAAEEVVGEVAQHVLSQIEERLAPLEEQLSAQQQQQLAVQAEQQIREELAELHEKYGDFNEDHVCELALNFEGEDALERGYHRLQEILASNEKSWFDQRGAEPRGAENGGQPNTAPEPITSFGAAKEAAKARMGASR